MPSSKETAVTLQDNSQVGCTKIAFVYHFVYNNQVVCPKIAIVYHHFVHKPFVDVGETLRHAVIKGTAVTPVRRVAGGHPPA